MGHLRDPKEQLSYHRLLGGNSCAAVDRYALVAEQPAKERGKFCDAFGARSLGDTVTSESRAWCAERSHRPPKCRLEKARPDPDFKYFSKRRAAGVTAEANHETTNSQHH